MERLLQEKVVRSTFLRTGIPKATSSFTPVLRNSPSSLSERCISVIRANQRNPPKRRNSATYRNLP